VTLILPEASNATGWARRCGKVGRVSWRDVLDGVDAVESWIAGQTYWVQVPVLLIVLLPLGWALAGLIDRGVWADEDARMGQLRQPPVDGVIETEETIGDH